MDIVMLQSLMQNLGSDITNKLISLNVKSVDIAGRVGRTTTGDNDILEYFYYCIECAKELNKDYSQTIQADRTNLNTVIDHISCGYCTTFLNYIIGDIDIINIMLDRCSIKDCNKTLYWHKLNRLFISTNEWVEFEAEFKDILSDSSMDAIQLAITKLHELVYPGFKKDMFPWELI